MRRDSHEHYLQELRDKSRRKLMKIGDLVIEEAYTKGNFQVAHVNGVTLGEFWVDVSGYYVFWPEHHSGYWDESILDQLSQALEEINRPWDEEVKQALGFNNAETNTTMEGIHPVAEQLPESLREPNSMLVEDGSTNLDSSRYGLFPEQGNNNQKKVGRLHIDQTVHGQYEKQYDGRVTYRYNHYIGGWLRRM